MAKQLIKYRVFLKLYGLLLSIYRFSLFCSKCLTSILIKNYFPFSGSSWFGQGSVLGWTLSRVALHCRLWGHKVSQPNPRIDSKCWGKFHSIPLIRITPLICDYIIQKLTVLEEGFIWCFLLEAHLFFVITLSKS